MKLAASLLVAALAFAPVMASAKDTASTKGMMKKETTSMEATTKAPKVDINTASESDLTKVFKSDTTAKKVIAGRTYSKTDDLLSKNIVKKAAYKKVENKIIVQ